MTIRRGIVASCALALTLSACAGTSDSSDEPNPSAATTEEASDAAEEQADEHATEATASVEDEDAADATAPDDDHDASGPAEEEPAHDDDHDDAVIVGDEDVDQVVEIAMDDMEFSVTELEFTVGDRVLFAFENIGAAPHEALIGDMHLQDEHEEQMAEGGGHHDGEGHHGDLSMISLAPGETGSFVHEFTDTGELWIGCHVPGHWGAGMQTRITVAA